MTQPDRLTLLKAQWCDVRRDIDNKTTMLEQIDKQLEYEQMARAIARKLQQEQQEATKCESPKAD